MRGGATKEEKERESSTTRRNGLFLPGGARSQKKGLTGHYVVVHAKEILAEGKTLDDAIKNLQVRFSSPPEPLLIRQVLGQRRTPIRMRSPQSVAGHTR
jgi:hypothetical protein